MSRRLPISSLFPVLLFPVAFASPLEAADWWNASWTQRQPVTVDSSAAEGFSGATGPATVLLRLHEGNFQFSEAGETGGDLRFVADDGTVYPHQIEKYDSLINEAFVWVKLPDVTSGSPTTFNLYYGNPAPEGGNEPAEAYDEGSVGVYHFGAAGNPVDASSNGNNGTTAAGFSEGSLIGGGLRLLGGEPVAIPASPSLAWPEGGPVTLSMWINPAALQPGAVLVARADSGKSFRLLLDQGIPFVEVGGVRSSPGAPLPAGTWSHLAVVADSGVLKIYVNGAEYSLAQAALPALNTSLTLGGVDGDVAGRFNGEMDELRLDKIARSAAWIKLAAVSQGTGDAAQRLVQIGTPETGEGGGEAAHGGAMEHIMLFGDIAKNMMFDGWIAIGLCVVMIVVGWTVAIRKFNYLNSIQKASREFLRQWRQLSSDLTAIDHSDSASIGSFGGKADAASQALVSKSPLYQIYHLGSEEIRHRLARDKNRTKGLSGRSIQAIRAALDGGLVHETHRLTKGLVFLTISIAGGPYVGLLGTVVGVMITFAIIAKSGEVDVNSIAPGIASALLATVAGLIVAIPALFIYSYLNSRIKETTSGMQVFIDEFVAKMAEFYPPEGEVSPHAPNSEH